MRSRRDILKGGSALLPVPWLPGCGSSSSGNGGVGIRSFSGQSAWSASQHLRYSFIEYTIDGPTIKATTWAVDTPEGQPAGALSIIDEFELAARSTLARLEAVRPVRAAERMLAENHVHNWRQIEADTRLRNARCMGETLWHMHV